METGGRPSQTGGVAPTILKVGHPISSFRGYVFEGVYQLDEKEEAANYGKQPGDAKYRDINNDGTISGEDITIIGSPFPDFYYGFNGTISYKNFDLNVMIQGSQGGKIYNIFAAELFGLGDRKSTRLNSSHVAISYAAFCLIKKRQK